MTRDGLSPCPDRECKETGPHHHPLVGDGLFAPWPDQAHTLEAAPMVFHDVPYVCATCGGTGTIPRLTPLPEGSSAWVLNRCERCPAARSSPVVYAPPPLPDLERPRRSSDLDL